MVKGGGGGGGAAGQGAEEEEFAGWRGARLCCTGGGGGPSRQVWVLEEGGWCGELVVVEVVHSVVQPGLFRRKSPQGEWLWAGDWAVGAVGKFQFPRPLSKLA